MAFEHRRQLGKQRRSLPRTLLRGVQADALGQADDDEARQAAARAHRGKRFEIREGARLVTLGRGHLRERPIGAGDPVRQRALLDDIESMREQRPRFLAQVALPAGGRRGRWQSWTSIVRAGWRAFPTARAAGVPAVPREPDAPPRDSSGT